jgi:hypothetical protein
MDRSQKALGRLSRVEPAAVSLEGYPPVLLGPSRKYSVTRWTSTVVAVL